MGGEKLFHASSLTNSRGSPPRRRGKVLRSSWTICRTGITPAWAGKSMRPRSLGCGQRDHPRVGGEKKPGGTAVQAAPGSPPHGRGKEGAQLAGLLLPGITPAWTGKSAGLALLLPRAGDHPRMGGEKRVRPEVLPSGQGSPPRGRGKVSGKPTGANYARITPAWAGKSISLHAHQRV